MSTFAGIIVQLKNENASYIGTVVHYDGYLLGVGEALLKVAPDYEKALELVELGELHSIKPDRVIAFHRDWGMSFDRVKPLYAKDIQVLEHVLECRMADQFYFFRHETWYYWAFKEGHPGNLRITSLELAVRDERVQLKRKRKKNEKFEISLDEDELVIRIGVDRVKSLIEGGSK